MLLVVGRVEVALTVAVLMALPVPLLLLVSDGKLMLAVACISAARLLLIAAEFRMAGLAAQSATAQLARKVAAS